MNGLKKRKKRKTDKKLIYYPSVESKEFIWKYLSNSNLLKNLNDLNLSDIDQVKFLEKATSEGIFEERDLLNLYKNFQFEIDDLINYEKVEDGKMKNESYLLVEHVLEFQIDLFDIDFKSGGR